LQPCLKYVEIVIIMKKQIILLAILCLTGVGMRAYAQNLDKLKLKTHLDSISYIIGYDNGKYFKTQGVDVNAAAFAKGLEQSLKDSTSIIPEADKVRLMSAFQQEMMKKMQEKKKGDLEQNKKLGYEFLEKNKKNANVRVTASGLQYEIMKEGTGKTPKATDEVTVNYVGKLLNNKVFDSSYDRGQPATFMLNGVIPGWTEGLQLMKEGAKYKFYIPYNLAYGEQGAGNDIPPGATLIFEVELISVQVK
jgi:FKBP-type peptidyl-prolyl cis-trans isomerase